MTEEEKINFVVYQLRAYNPKTKKEAEKFLKLRKIGDGAYRTTYKIVGVPMVIKFPLHGHESGKNHTRAEIKAVSKINRLKKFETLRDLVPKIHYAHIRNGVVAMKYYKPFSKVKCQFTYTIVNLLEKITKLMWPEAMKDETVDICQVNLGIDNLGNIVFIDLGYFLPLGKGEDDSW